MDLFPSKIIVISLWLGVLLNGEYSKYLLSKKHCNPTNKRSPFLIENLLLRVSIKGSSVFQLWSSIVYEKLIVLQY